MATLTPLRTILLSMVASRPIPKIIIEPPVIVEVYSYHTLVTPFAIEKTYIGEKITVESEVGVTMIVRSKNSSNRYKIFEAKLTFLHIFDMKEEIMRLVNVAPNDIPKEVIDQLASISFSKAIAVLISLQDRMEIPSLVPIPTLKSEEENNAQKA
ncbi:MAG: hypothetical protein GXO32_02365 [Crenarchaeota archaeon]|nr:hypothetical protein [Thermoproteota archaeon]